MKHPPQEYIDKRGTMQVEKGKKGKIKIYTWDLIDPCRLNKCDASDVCWFLKNVQMTKADGTPKKCRVMFHFLTNASNVLFEDVGNMDQYTVWRVGMRLLPMYRSLCKLLIADAGLASPITLNHRGNIVLIPMADHIGRLQQRIDRIERDIFGAGTGKSRTPLPFERPTTAPGKKRVK
jgi:hypothetical protein